jgi:hypothetical protein
VTFSTPTGDSASLRFSFAKTLVDECDDDVRYLISSKCREAGIHR